jgi:hypothetical protein
MLLVSPLKVIDFPVTHSSALGSDRLAFQESVEDDLLARGRKLRLRAIRPVRSPDLPRRHVVAVDVEDQVGDVARGDLDRTVPSATAIVAPPARFPEAIFEAAAGRPPCPLGEISTEPSGPRCSRVTRSE